MLRSRVSQTWPLLGHNFCGAVLCLVVFSGLHSVRGTLLAPRPIPPLSSDNQNVSDTGKCHQGINSSRV